MFERTEYILLPPNDHLNAEAEREVGLLLESDSEMVYINEEYSMADVIIIDDDSKFSYVRT